jgi:outer membrane protein TolC
VQVSLVNLDKQTQRYESLRRQTESAAGSVDYQLRSFQRGVGNYIAYLDSRQNLASAEINLASAERSLADARLAVHRALGGAWVQDDEDIGQQLEEEYDMMDQLMFPSNEEAGR